ncbi:MAG: hypothetical protein EOP36_20095 [Rubrivivax sp.]|nr:MAG: hypothetical protein EOP36_20095 [Rubrivivax sp.]
MFRTMRDVRGRYMHPSYWQKDFVVRAGFDVLVDGRTMKIERVLELPNPEGRHVQEELARLTWYTSYARREQVADFIAAQLDSGTVQGMLHRLEGEMQKRREEFLHLRKQAMRAVNMVILDYHDLHGGGMVA